MPIANSRPTRSRSAESRARRIIFRPPPPKTRSPSRRKRRSTSRSTRPSTPASPTSRLVPAPMTRAGMPRSRAPRSAAAGSAISTKKSAGPPMLKEVWRASGCASATPGSERSQVRLPLLRQLMGNFPDVAGAHEEDEVARLREAVEVVLDSVEMGREASSRHLLDEVDRGRPIGLLARRVDLGDDHLVGAFEGGGELVQEPGEAAVAVRLEDQDHALGGKLACRLERRPHLGGVVAVVVEDAGAPPAAQELHPAMGTREAGERLLDNVEAHPQLQGQGGGAGGVEQVVTAGDAEAEAELGRRVVALLEPVRDAPPGDLETHRLRVIGADDGELGDLARKPLEHLANRGQVREVVGVVELDIGDDRVLRVVQD